MRGKELDEKQLSDNHKYCLTKPGDCKLSNQQNEANFVIVDSKVEKVDYNFFQSG